MQPFHLHIHPLCGCSSTMQGNLGDIDRRDLPAKFRQPDGVCPFAATDVEGYSWFDAAHF
jgi:hypothetical protein